MLVLKRNTGKRNQQPQGIQLEHAITGEVIEVVLLDVGKHWGKIGIEAPQEWRIHRLDQPAAVASKSEVAA